MKDPKKLSEAKKAGLIITDIDPNKNKKCSDFIENTEGNKMPIEQAYILMGLGDKKRPKDKKLAKRYDAARKRLKNKGLI